MVLKYTVVSHNCWCNAPTQKRGKSKFEDPALDEHISGDDGPTVRDTIIQIYMCALDIKGKDRNQTWVSVKHWIQLMKGSPAVEPQVRAALSTDKREILAFLANEGLYDMDEVLVEYDLCYKCYTIYHGEAAASPACQKCLNPDCDGLRKDALLLYYRYACC